MGLRQSEPSAWACRTPHWKPPAGRGYVEGEGLAQEAHLPPESRTGHRCSRAACRQGQPAQGTVTEEGHAPVLQPGGPSSVAGPTHQQQQAQGAGRTESSCPLPTGPRLAGLWRPRKAPPAEFRPQSVPVAQVQEACGCYSPHQSVSRDGAQCPLPRPVAAIGSVCPECHQRKDCKREVSLPRNDWRSGGNGAGNRHLRLFLNGKEETGQTGASPELSVGWAYCPLSRG